MIMIKVITVTLVRI